MKKVIVLLLLLAATPVSAETLHFRGYEFQSYIVSDSPSPGWYEKRNRYQGSIYVREGGEYSVLVKNPLPVRVAVSVSVDGLNTIDGRSGRMSQGRKWIIQPYGSITIRGWQTGDNNLRKFVFTRPRYSYAAWRERRDGRRLTQNLGEIKVAYFWNREELRDVLSPPIEYGYKNYPTDNLSSRRHMGLSAPSRFDQKAGTGMGRHEHNPVRAVNFHYNTGMYSERNVLTIRYSFDNYRDYHAPYQQWQPSRRYAPEMP
jgi:hypothetical protein